MQHLELHTRYLATRMHILVWTQVGQIRCEKSPRRRVKLDFLYNRAGRPMPWSSCSPASCPSAACVCICGHPADIIKSHGNHGQQSTCRAYLLGTMPVQVAMKGLASCRYNQRGREREKTGRVWGVAGCGWCGGTLVILS